jgi:2-phosphosulfolactate phosphatase
VLSGLRVVQLGDRAALDGLVVVIDVIRAFTTAAAAFAAGAERILCVETVDEAFGLRESHPGAILMGEVHGARPDGFDFGNSPVQIATANLAGRLIIQRTSNGTRGLVAAAGAETVLAAAATNVSATAEWIGAERPGADVTALCTGSLSEDEACARHLDAILRGDDPSPAALAAAVRFAGEEHRQRWQAGGGGEDADDPIFDADMAACADVDRYGFVMLGRAAGRTVELRAVHQ